MQKYKRIEKCRVCGGHDLRKYLDLGEVPLANGLLNSPYQEFDKYPIEVLFCSNCFLSQLSIVVSPDVLYQDYPYHSSISDTFKNHCSELASTAYNLLLDKSCPEMISVVDIAANDGCLLNEFKKLGLSWLVGVEPAKNLAKLCESKGFQVKNEFWNSETMVPRANIFTATNVLAHVDNLKEFVTKISDSLNWLNTGFCVIEVPYLVDLIENNQFDTIYHEHLSYFLFKPLKILFESCGMRIFRVERKPIHGGSIRIYATRNPFNYLRGYKNLDGLKQEAFKETRSDYPTENSVHELEIYEQEMGFYEFDHYVKFSERVELIRNSFFNFLSGLKGKRVIGYGASAKGASLLNYSEINRHHIQMIIDDTPAKQGKFLPLSNIPICSKDSIENPEYVIVLAWNFANEIMEKTKSLKEHGSKYVIPVPELTVA